MRYLILIFCTFLMTMPVVASGATKKKPQPVKVEAEQPKAGPIETSKSKETEEWKQEPTSVLGIKLGAPLHELINPCPVETLDGGARLVQWYKTKAACYNDVADSDGDYETHNLPNVVPWGDTFLIVKDGNVEGIKLYLKHDYYETLKELFIAKYGKPHSIDKAEYKNKTGAIFIGETSFWNGRNLFLAIKEYAGRLDYSSVLVETNSYFNYQQNKKREETNASLDKL